MSQCLFRFRYLGKILACIDTVQVMENSAVWETTVTLNGGINAIIIMYRN